MGNHVRHFAIPADDVERARTFYAAVFDWYFEPWGPPNSYLIRTGPEGDRGLQGALQLREEDLIGGGLRGFECTIGVQDLDEILDKIEAHGGRIVLPRFHIDEVGHLSFFEDTERNRVGVMQYEPSYRF